MKKYFYSLFLLTILFECKNSEEVDSSSKNTDNFIEFKIDSVLYRVTGLTGARTSGYESNTSYTKAIRSRFDTNAPKQEATLYLTLRGSQNSFEIKNYTFSPSTDKIEARFFFNDENENDFDSTNLPIFGNFEITHFEAKSFGLVEGTFNMAGLQLKKKGIIISTSGKLTEGKFRFHLDEDWNP